VGLLFAPEKGDDTRKRIADALREQGVKLKGSKLDNLVDDIAEVVKDKID
jgi:gas vesicle protein